MYLLFPPTRPYGGVATKPFGRPFAKHLTRRPFLAQGCTEVMRCVQRRFSWVLQLCLCSPVAVPDLAPVHRPPSSFPPYRASMAPFMADSNPVTGATIQLWSVGSQWLRLRRDASDQRDPDHQRRHRDYWTATPTRATRTTRWPPEASPSHWTIPALPQAPSSTLPPPAAIQALLPAPTTAPSF
jgi:hypothetical protein